MSCENELKLIRISPNKNKQGMRRGFWGLGLVFSLGGLGVQTFAASGALGLLVLAPLVPGPGVPGPTPVQPDTVYRSEVLPSVTLVGVSSVSASDFDFTHGV